jgi:hypothetical protein
VAEGVASSDSSTSARFKGSTGALARYAVLAGTGGGTGEATCTFCGMGGGTTPSSGGGAEGATTSFGGSFAGRSCGGVANPRLDDSVTTIEPVSSDTSEGDERGLGVCL